MTMLPTFPQIGVKQAVPAFNKTAPQSQSVSAQIANQDQISIRFAGQTNQAQLVQKILKGHENFSVALMDQLADEVTAESKAWSSWNLYGLLTGLASGSRELAPKLGLPVDASTSQEAVNKALRARVHEIVDEATQKDMTLRNELGIWAASHDSNVDPDQKLVPEFRKNARALEAEVGTFVPGGSVQHINQWSSDKTNGKIDKLFKDGDLNQDDSAVLAQVFYMLANWTDQFSKDATVDRPFHTPDGKETPVKMMRKGGIKPAEYQQIKQKLSAEGLSDAEIGEKIRKLTEGAKVPYRETDTYQAVSMEFGTEGETIPNPKGWGPPKRVNETRFALTLFVPKKVDGLRTVYNELSGQDANGASRLVSVLNEMATSSPRELDALHLPKFTQKGDIDWKPHLENMGLPLDKLNVTQEQFRERVDRIKGKSFVRVNEEGAEMAFVDFAVIRSLSISANPSVVADRPFMWAFTMTKSGETQVLAQGTVVQPPEYDEAAANKTA